MYTKIQVVFDAAEPEKLAEFWGLALGYVVEPPPETSCMTWASDTFCGPITIPAAEATRIAVSTIVSRSASSPDGGSYAPSP